MSESAAVSEVCSGTTNQQAESGERLENEDETSLTASTSLSSTSTTTMGCSRRRLAFSRPQSAGKMATTKSGIASTESDVPNISKASAADLSGALGNNKSRKLAPWNIRTPMNFQDSLVFYEGLKQHGKDFEAIAKYMNKKKVQKDRDQVRNFYFNAFKIWRAKAQMEESEWANVPRDAQELLIVINGCEWRKRTNGAINLHPVKFRSLIVDGYTSVRTKKKKGSSIFIRTPYCPSLLRFFPYEKRNSEIPTHISVRLTPLSHGDRNYVIACEQNPLLSVQLSINDRLSSLFSLLKRKWISPLRRMTLSFAANNDVRSIAAEEGVKFVLHVNENTKIHRVQIDVNKEKEGCPMMSLSKLKRDHAVEGEMLNAESNSQDASTSSASLRTPREQIEGVGALIKLSSAKEVFDIDEEKIKRGLSEENCGNASMLQLFYLCGMSKSIMLSYEVCKRKPEVEPWALFVNLLGRDYAGAIARTMQCQQSTAAVQRSTPAPGSPSEDALRRLQLEQATREKRSRQGVVAFKQGVTPTPEPDIVERENRQFDLQLQQLSQPNRQVVSDQLNLLNQSQRRKQAKRQVKLIPSNQRNIYNNLCTEIYPSNVPNATLPQYAHIQQPVERIGPLGGDSAQPVTYYLANRESIPAYIVGDGIMAQYNNSEGPSQQIIATHLPGPQQNNLRPTMERQGFGQTSRSSASTSAQPTDFSQLTVIGQGKVVTHSEDRLLRPPPPPQARAEIAALAGSEFSLDSTLSSFINNPLNLDASPNKTLPDDVRNAYEMMLKENSVDYCKNFEQLTERLEDTARSATSQSSVKKGAKTTNKRA